MGRGGSAIVYEVRDLLREPEISIAAKVVTAELSSAGLERLRNEFRTLAGMRHQHLVRVFDLHLLPGVNPSVLTMELVHGDPFLTSARELPLSMTIGLLQQACLALAHLHRNGIAHRDIKSENFLVEKTNGRPRLVLMDLGLAGADGLILSGETGGTPFYLPPEVLDGKPADRRGDLYSLGVLAYKLLGGEFPFRESDSQSLFEAIQSSSHRPLHELAPHLSPQLCSLVERLLNRDPERRVQSASELFAALAPHAQTYQNTDRVCLPSPDDWIIAGRKREIALFQRGIDKINPHHGKSLLPEQRSYLMEGEAGVGKTRLLLEIQKQAQLASVAYIQGNCVGPKHAPLHSLSDALRQIIRFAKCHVQANKQCAEILSTHEQLIASVVERQSVHMTTSTTWLEERSTWVQDQVVRLLVALSRCFPFVLAIDDIHKADPSTLACLRAITSQPGEARFLVIYTVREDEASRVKSELSDTPINFISLASLKVSELEHLVAGFMDNSSEVHQVAVALDRLTGGRPLFIDLVFQQLAGRGHIRSVGPAFIIDSSALDKLPVLESVNSWAMAWLSQLDRDETAAIQALSVLNRPTDPSTLCRIASETTADPVSSHTISRLISRRVLIQAGGSSTGPVSFSHALFRETVYHELSEDTRAAFHSRVADAILSESKDSDTHRAAELAMHLREAGRNEEAARYALQAAHLAYRTFALDEAERFYRLALDYSNPNDTEAQLETIEGFSEVLILGHRHDEAGALLRSLIKRATEAKRPDYLARGLAGLAEVYLGSSQYDQAEQLAERALRIAKEIGDPRTEARALRSFSDTRHYQSRLDEAKAAYSALVSLWEVIGDDLGSASAWHNLGWVCNSMRNFEEASQHFERAEVIYRRIGNIPRLANTLSALGANQLDAGHFHSAVERLEDALHQAGRSRGRRTEALCHGNLGQARLRLGQFNAAIDNLENARRTLLLLRNTRYLAPVDMTIGWVLTEQAEYGRAEKFLASAREAYLSLEDQPGLAMCLAAQANIYRLLGDPTSARFWCERSLEIARAANDSQVIAICLTSMSLALFEEEENLQAVDALLEARSLAREVGAGDTEHLACLALSRVLLMTDRLGDVAGMLQRLLERAEKMHLAADIPAILFLQGLFKLRFGELKSARRLLDDAILRADVTSAAETRWELRQLRSLIASPEEDAVVERLNRELTAWLQSCASTIPEEERRRAFLRRAQSRADHFKAILDLPSLSRASHSAVPETAVAASDKPRRESIQPPIPAQGSVPGAIRSLCKSSEEAVRLQSVLNLLVDRAVHGTQSVRGGLFFRDTAGALLPVALRNLVRESLADAQTLSLSVLRIALEHDGPVVASDLFEDPRWMEALTVRARDIPAVLATPISDAGVLYLDRTDSGRPYGKAERRVASYLADQLAGVLASLRNAGETWTRLHELELAIHYFDREIVPRSESAKASVPVVEFGKVKMVGSGPLMAAVFDQTRRLAASRTPVLIVGETGTGKELVARALHEASPWADSPFVALDCGALTENLAEAELFGHARGAFSGAERDRSGLLRSAGDGTLFLDEIGNLAPPLQLKLLRALETGEVRPVGADHVEPVRFRLVAATNIDLPHEIRKGRFREDLHHRLQGGTIRLPPLRDHMEDLETLVRRFLEEIAEQLGRPAPELSPAAWNALHAHHWPGNVRELRMALQVALAMTDRAVLEPIDLPERITDTPPGPRSGAHKFSLQMGSDKAPAVGGIRVPEELEGRMVLRVLAENSWDKAASARRIGWSRQKLYRTMKLYRIPLRVSDAQLQEIHDHVAMLQASVHSPPTSPSTH